MNNTTDPAELTCQELVELITEYLEHQLTVDDTSRFESHLADCPGCNTYLEQMRRTVGLVGRLDETSLSREVQTALIQAFHDWKSGS